MGINFQDVLLVIINAMGLVLLGLVAVLFLALLLDDDVIANVLALLLVLGILGECRSRLAVTLTTKENSVDLWAD